MKKISIVFMGSGPVAAKSLELLSKSFAIEAVITKPKPKHHKGSFPVLDIAIQYNHSVHLVTNKKDISDLIKITSFKSKIAILIDFGILVGLDIIDYFQYGIINSHFSLLPEWRGADPITFTLLSGQNKTGVSLMLVDKGLDTGKILAQKSLKIPDHTDSAYLTDKLISLSNEMLSVNIPKYISGEIKPRKQSHPDRATYSKKLKKSDGVIDWTKPAIVLEREIRAFSQWPKSITSFGGKEVIITDASIFEATGTPGNIDVDNKNLIVYTSDKALKILKLKPAGKNEMSIESFLAGYKNIL